MAPHVGVTGTSRALSATNGCLICREISPRTSLGRHLSIFRAALLGDIGMVRRRRLMNVPQVQGGTLRLLH